jgi:hypothetical protein
MSTLATVTYRQLRHRKGIGQLLPHVRLAGSNAPCGRLSPSQIPELGEGNYSYRGKLTVLWIYDRIIDKRQASSLGPRALSILHTSQPLHWCRQ